MTRHQIGVLVAAGISWLIGIEELAVLLGLAVLITFLSEHRIRFERVDRQ
jgi:hypothetical protein